MPVADHFMAGHGKGANSNVRPGAVCERCFAYFANDTELWRHMRLEHRRANDGLECPAPGCGKRFLARALCTAHLAHHNGVVMLPAEKGGGPVPAVSRPLTCELCGRLSANVNALKKHTINRHPESQDFMCGVCALLMHDVDALVSHVRGQHAAELRDQVRFSMDETSKTRI